jgi:hypothetical protein
VATANVRGWAFLAACAVCSAGSAHAEQEPPPPADPLAPAPRFFEQQPEPAEPSGLTTVSEIGLITFGIGYLPSLGVGLGYLLVFFPIQYALAETGPEPALTWLLLPAAGPFFGANTSLLEGELGWQAAYIGVGLLQVVGLAMWSLGLFADDGEQPVARARRPRIAYGRDGPSLTLRF